MRTPCTIIEHAVFHLIVFWYERNESQEALYNLLVPSIDSQHVWRAFCLLKWTEFADWLIRDDGYSSLRASLPYSSVPSHIFLVPEFPSGDSRLTEDEQNSIIARTTTKNKKTEINIHRTLLFSTNLKSCSWGDHEFRSATQSLLGRGQRVLTYSSLQSHRSPNIRRVNSGNPVHFRPPNLQSYYPKSLPALRSYHRQISRLIQFADAAA